jgi:hypothetical protein
VAHLRGVLHHLERPIEALGEAFRLAPVVVSIEPNGYNPVLKVLEKVSRYHRDHEEKSYLPLRLDRWVTTLRGVITCRQWIGFVPMFCPDWLAQTLKTIEPTIERLPCLNRICCGQYIFVAHRG